MMKENFTVEWEEVFTSTNPISLSSENLTGEKLTLEPLKPEHWEELYQLIDPGIWQWYTTPINNTKDMDAYIDKQLSGHSAGTSRTYVVRLNETGELVGSSRFCNVDKPNKRVEIGSTWYSPKWQRTFVNTECKLLMLTHAFETLGCICVQFQTDSLNSKSRAAILRIGAKADGILRNHRICHDGRIRHSAFYSITEKEWPETKEHILKLMRGIN